MGRSVGEAVLAFLSVAVVGTTAICMGLIVVHDVGALFANVPTMILVAGVTADP